MTLDDFKKMKELKLSMEEYQLKFKAQPVAEKKVYDESYWKDEWYGYSAGSTARTEEKPKKEKGGKREREDKGKGKRDRDDDKGKGKNKKDSKGKGKKGVDFDDGVKGSGKDKKGGKKGKGKDGVDFDPYGSSDGKGKGKDGKNSSKSGGKGSGKDGNDYDAFWNDKYGAVVENYNREAADLTQQDVERNMMLATREAFLGVGGVTDGVPEHFTTKRWETQDNLCDLSFDALKDNFQYEYMTKVQSWSYPFIIAGKDVLARSKTGTGKTLAFLVPTVEKIFKNRNVDVEKCYDSAQQDWYMDPNHKILMDEDNYVASLVISPTRELAQAIGDECYRLTSYWYKMFRTTIIYGGVKLHWDYDIYDKARIDMLVATPGRLSDHLQNTKDFSEKINNCPFSFTLILDEADRLLEMGFRDEIEKIIRYLPSNKRPKGEKASPEDEAADDVLGKPLRQSLLFSATVPEMVHNIGKMALRSDYRFVDCGNDEEDAQREEEVTQKLLVCEPSELLETFFNLLLQAMREYPKNHKIMVFFITAKQTQFMSEAAGNYLPELAQILEKQGTSSKITTKVHEIHSRMPYADRDYVKTEFRDAKKGILFSSDVSAKSNDIENVTHVIQVGVPANKEQYLNRLGRTSNKQVLVLHPFEKYFLYQDLKDHPQLERINMRIGWEESAIQKDKI